MARIYSTDESHSCDYGIDFYNGAAAIPESESAVIAEFVEKGYAKVEGVDSLLPWDYLTKAQLIDFAKFAGIAITTQTKAKLVDEIEAALITLMAYEITAFDPIADVDAGKAGSAAYANAAAVKAVLPARVTAAVDGKRVSVPVSVWVDTDTYNPASAAKYTFTATLGTVPQPFANTAAATATVEVEVRA
jgi:hypothetical protein